MGLMRWHRWGWWLLVVLLAACVPTEVKVKETVVVTQKVTVAPVIKVVTPTPPPAEDTPRQLVVCLGQEPDTLYPYGSRSPAARSVLEAVYDGPIDTRSYEYQPVILEKLPLLADGDARRESVVVAPGDPIVDAAGEVTVLMPGVRFRPAGCLAANCVETYAEEMGAVNMDQLVVTFKLLPGLKWSDGEPLTADDSVYSFHLAEDADTPVSKYKIERTAGYEALDEETIRWVGLPGFLDPTYFLNFWSPYPEHLWGQYTAAELLQAEESAQRPVGWGPYVIDEWVKGDHITLHRNPHYFRAAEGLPPFDHLIFRFIGQNANTALAALLAGECDVVDQTARLDTQMELLLELKNAGQIQLGMALGGRFEQVALGIHPAAEDDGWQPGDRPAYFDDVRVRQALALCMDRQQVVDEVLLGQSVVMDTYLPPEHPLYNPDVPHYAYDVAAGSALLEEAGWVDADGDPATPRVYRGDNPHIPQGTPLSLRYWFPDAAQEQQVAEILQQSLARCGVQLTLQALPLESFTAPGPEGAVFGRDFDLAQFAWQTDAEKTCALWSSDTIPGDPARTVEEVPWLQAALGDTADPQAPAFPYGWGGGNIAAYSNPDFDRACRQARTSLPDRSEYVSAHQQAQRIFAEDLPAIPLYLGIRLAAARPDLCGLYVDPTAASELWNIEAMDYGEQCSSPATGR